MQSKAIIINIFQFDETNALHALQLFVKLDDQT